MQKHSYDLILREPIQNDRDYADTPNLETISEHKNAAIHYIAWAVVKMVQCRLKYRECNNECTDHFW